MSGHFSQLKGSCCPSRNDWLVGLLAFIVAVELELLFPVLDAVTTTQRRPAE